MGCRGIWHVYIVEFGENDEENLETYIISNFIVVVSGWVAKDWTVE